MNNLFGTLKTTLCAAAAIAVATSAFAQKLPAKKKVLADMQLANDYFMKEWPDPGAKVTVKGITRESTLWTRGVYYEGLMAMYKIDPQKKYYDYAVSWGDTHQWAPRDGKITRNADNQCAAQTYIDLYLIDKKPERIDKMKQCVDLMVNSDKSDDWNWVDALQMAMPVFARFGALYNDNKYYERMYDIYNYTKTVHGGKELPVAALFRVATIRESHEPPRAGGQGERPSRSRPAGARSGSDRRPWRRGSSRHRRRSGLSHPARPCAGPGPA